MSFGPDWEVEGRGWPNREHSRLVDVGRIKWHVQMMGEGPPVLLLHGTGAATHSWRALAPLLAGNFTIVAPDLPGHGFTRGRPAGGLTMPAMARAVSELIGAMEIEPRFMVAHSAGTAIALRMVLDGQANPAAIVGLDAALLPFPGLAAKLFPAMAKLLFVNPLAPHLFANLARMPGETARFLKRSVGSTIDDEGVRLYERLFRSPGHIAGAITMMAEWDLESLKRDLPRIQTPVLLVHGERDAAVPLAKAHEAAALLPNARVESMPGLGHLAHEERPDELARIIQAFAGER